jgi:hypothetical protein
MLSALEAGKQKLSVYYSQSTQVHLYAVGTIIAPQYKLKFFSSSDWADNDYEWREKYRQSLEEFIQPYKEQHLGSNEYQTHCPQTPQGSKLAALLARSNPVATSNDSQPNELEQYLESGM